MGKQTINEKIAIPESYYGLGTSSTNALHIIAEINNCEMIKLLVENGADVNLKDGLGRTSLHIATQNRNVEIVQYLLKNGANVDLKDIHGDTTLSVAFKNGSIEIIKMLIENGAEENLNVTNSSGDAILHSVVRWKEKGLKYLDYLIKKGAAVNIKNREGRTPLHIAAHINNLEIISYLVEHGTNLYLQDTFGDTALHYAVKHGERGLETVDYLIKKGADVNVKGRGGNTPLTLASGVECLTQILVDYGAIIRDT